MLLTIKQVVFDFYHEYAVSVITSWVNDNKRKFDSKTFKKNDVLLKLDEKYCKEAKFIKVIYKNEIFWILDLDVQEVP
jgi:hypothetical protein